MSANPAINFPLIGSTGHVPSNLVKSHGGNVLSPALFGYSATADAAQWHLAGTGATLALMDDMPGGGIALASSSTNPAHLSVNGEAYRLAEDYVNHLEVRGLTLGDGDGMSLFFGLAITGLTPWTSVSDWVGFHTTNGVINIGAAKNSAAAPGSGAGAETSSATGLSFADGNAVNDVNASVDLALRTFADSRVEFWVNGTPIGSINTNLPDDEALTPTLSIVGSGETVRFRDIAALTNAGF